MSFKMLDFASDQQQQQQHLSTHTHKSRRGNIENQSKCLMSIKI